MKKWFVLLTLTLMVAVCLIPATAMAAPSVSGTYFYAKGTPITIASPDASPGSRTAMDVPSGLVNVYKDTPIPGGSLIYWGKDDSTGGYIYASSNVDIFGGSFNTTVNRTSITMVGGTVNSLYGGGLGSNSGVTGEAEIIFEGGTVSHSVCGGNTAGYTYSGSDSVSIEGSTKIGSDGYTALHLVNLVDNKVQITGKLTADANIKLIPDKTEDGTVVAEATEAAHADASKFTAKKGLTSYNLMKFGNKIIIGTPVAVAFSGLTANGVSNIETTTLLTLTFDKDVTGLSADDITLSIPTITKGTLTKTGTGVYTLGISGITADGDSVTVNVAKDGLTFNPSSKTVTVYLKAQNASVTPTTATYDKYTATAGLDFTLTPGSYTLSAIRNGGTALTSGTDYTVSGNVYTIAQSYLNAQTVGTVTLTFDMDGGTDPTAVVTVSDTTPVNASVTPTTATYDKYTATAGLDFTLTPGSYTLSAIQSGGTTLASGTDYTVSGNVYTIAQSFLDAQTVGTVTLTFDMDGGTDPTAQIAISDSAPAPSIIFNTQPAAETTVTVGSISGSLTVVATASTGQVVTLNWYECNDQGVISGGSLGTGGSFEIPTSLWVGEYYYLCQATLAGAADVNSEVAKVTVSIIYDITDGADGVWEQGGTNGLGFTANGSYEIFQNEVTVDGNQLNTDDFDSHHGSTIITLKPAYLNTLALGAHTLRVVFRDGYAQTNFTITSAGGPTSGPTGGPTVGPTVGPTAGPTSKPTKPPKTGDSSAPVIWLSLCLLCGTGLALFCRRRRGA